GPPNQVAHGPSGPHTALLGRIPHSSGGAPYRSFLDLDAPGGDFAANLRSWSLMCHPEIPEGHTAPEVDRLEVDVPLIGNREHMPALLCRPQTGAGAGVLVVAD